MKIEQSLFEGQHIRLGPIDYDQDPKIHSQWTHDAEFLRLLDAEPARPLSPFQVKKKYEAIEKEQEEERNLYYFTIRLCEDDRLIGFVRLYWIGWSNGEAILQLGIGDPSDRRKGYGTECMRLILRYAFEELNLYHLTALIPEYNQPAQRLFTKFGFVEEVRRRQALYRDGKRWDALHYGILRQEWKPV